jgi:hypothetical protein
MHSKVPTFDRSRLAASLGAALLAAGLLALSGCSSSSSSSKPQVGAIAFTDVNGTAQKSLQLLTQGESTYLTVALTGDPENLGANWSVYCGSALPPGSPLPPGQTQDPSCGAFVPVHTLSTPVPSYLTSASGYVTLYTAPAAPPKQGVVTLYAAATSDPSHYTSVTLSILDQYISVHLSPPPPATLDVGASTQLTAVVANDPTDAGVSWTASCGGAGDCGSFNPATTATGVATTYTAPAAVPSGSTSSGLVQVTVASVADPTRTATFTITIATAGS